MESSLVQLLNIFANRKDTQAAALIHDYITKNNINHGLVNDHIIHVNVKCGILYSLENSGIIAWNGAISGHLEAGNAKEAIFLFRRMQLDGNVRPNKITFITILRACKCRYLGKWIHTLVLESGYGGCKFVNTALINMYSSCDCLKEALWVFEGMAERDVASWTSIISAFAQAGYFAKAFILYRRMLQEGFQPDEVAFAAVSHAISRDRNWKLGMKIQKQVFEAGLSSHVVVGTALIAMFGSCGNVKAARRAFRRLPDWDLSAWNTLLRAHVDCGNRNTFAVLKRMIDDQVAPNEDTLQAALEACVKDSDLDDGKLVHAMAIKHGMESKLVNAILHMYRQCGGLEDAKLLFDRTTELDAVSWNTMVVTYGQHKRWPETLNFFKQMQLEGYRPDEAAFIAAVRCCGSLKLLKVGKQLHSWFLEGELYGGSNAVKYALLSMYGSCESFEDISEVFNQIKQPDTASWTWMILACKDCGRRDEAARTFMRMQLEGVKPNRPAFVAALAASCSYEAVRRIHGFVLETEYKLDKAVGNALLKSYQQCGGRPDDGEAVLRELRQIDATSCNAMISLYEKSKGYNLQAIQLLRKMDLECIKPSSMTFSMLLNMDHLEVSNVEFIHDCILEYGLVAEVCSELIKAYSKCGRMGMAFSLFKSYPESTNTWNAVLDALLNNGYQDTVFPLFQRMLQEGVIPDTVTFQKVFLACTIYEAQLLRSELQMQNI